MSSYYGGPKGSNTNQFTKTQNSFPKHISVQQNTNQFTKTQNNFLKQKPIFQDKSVYQDRNQFHKTQTNFAKHKSKDWALALSLSESLEGTNSQDFLRPAWRLLICCPDVRKCSATTVGLKSYKSISIALNVEQNQTLLFHLFDNCCLPKIKRKRGRRGLLTLTVGSFTTLFFAFLRSIMTCRQRG